MFEHLVSYIDDITAANQVTADWHQVDITAGTDPDQLSAWLGTAAKLAAIDTLRLATARAWTLVFDVAGDRYLDGNLNTHATTLHVIAGTWAHSDDDRATTLKVFLADGVRLNILQFQPSPATAGDTNPPTADAAAADLPRAGTGPDHRSRL